MNSKGKSISIVIILLIILQYSLSTLYAQQLVSATEPKEIWKTKVDANSCEFLKIASDGSIVVLGSKESGDSYAVLKYTSQGEPVWMTILDTTRSLYASSITEVKDEGFSISGFIGVSTARFASVTYGYASIIDYSGKITWKREIKDDTKDLFIQLYDNPYILTKEGDYALMYASRIPSENFSKDFKLLFHIYHKNGEVNDVVIDTIFNCDQVRIRTFEQTKDGGFIGYFYPMENNRPREYYLLKLDKDGNVQWKKTWKEDVYTYYGGKALILQDGSFAVVNNTIGPVANAQLRKFSANGELVYHKQIVAKRQTVINSMIETKSHGLLLVGATLDYDGSSNSWPRTLQDYYLGETNSDGDIIQQSIWGEENKCDGLTQIAIAEDGSYIIGGYNDELGVSFISKVLPNISSISEGKPEGSNLSVEIVSQGKEYRADYTLGQTAKVSMSLYDILGKEVTKILQESEEQSGRKSVSIPTSHLESGQYYLRCTNGINILTKPLVIIK